MKTAKDIRRALREKRPTVGTWLQIPSADSAEIIARMGYDWAAVDMEHGAFTRADLPNIFRALERWGTMPFVRVAEGAMREIKACLDSGARGLIFPMIETWEQLDEAIMYSLYPGGKEFPHGRRGVGFSRANSYGLDFTAHTEPEGLGHDLVLVAQIEHVNALDNLEAIFSHPRLDAYMVGPYDLSASMGLTGQFEHPEFLKALTLIEQQADARGLPKGFHVVQPDPEALIARAAQGYTFLAYGIDSLFLQSGRRPAGI